MQNSMAAVLKAGVRAVQGPSPEVVLLDIGGVLTPDPWQSLLLTPGDGLADRLGIDRSSVEEAASGLWAQFSLDERAEQDWWEALGRMVGTTIPQGLVEEVEARVLRSFGGADELIREAQRIGEVGLISDNTSFWYPKQAKPLGLKQRTRPSLRFLSFEWNLVKSSAPVGLFEVAAQYLAGRRTVVVDDRETNCDRARSAGLEAILMVPHPRSAHG
jgi:hypothetical protein